MEKTIWSQPNLEKEQDFHTGDPIDLLRSRRTSVTEQYFVSIPATERNQVKYLISDMYNPYIAYVEKDVYKRQPLHGQTMCQADW